MRPLSWAGLAFALCLTGCAQPEAETPDSRVPFKVIAEGSDSGITLEKILILKTPAEFLELWLAHDRRRNPPPEIDFTTNMVLGIFLGQKYTGGHTVDIRGIESNGQQLDVHVAIRTPAPDSQRSMALTQPYILVALPRSEQRINYLLTQIQ